MFMKVINVPHHIDCTYKLCERGFPVLVFGISDIMGQFFPIAFSIISHEQEDDFTRFFQTSMNLKYANLIFTTSGNKNLA